jgi:hypothetical protein
MTAKTKMLCFLRQSIFCLVNFGQLSKSTSHLIKFKCEVLFILLNKTVVWHRAVIDHNGADRRKFPGELLHKDRFLQSLPPAGEVSGYNWKP